MKTWAQSNDRMIFNKIPGSVYLWTAILIFAASNSITRKVTEIGAVHLIHGRNPISLCNVLFVGNLCALIVMLLIFGKQWNPQTLKTITYKDWIGLCAIALLANGLAPALIFAALDQTSVTSVVLIGRLEPPLTLTIAALFLKARFDRWTIAGTIVGFIGVATTAFLSQSEHPIPVMGGLFHIGRGELQIAAAALLLAISTVVIKARLQHIPLGIFNIVRVAVGTVVFFTLAKILYGSQHFVDIFSPFLWKWMLLYGSVIVVAGQLCWFAGLRSSTSSEAILAGSFNPIAAIAMAYLILGEVPTMAQYIGGSIILVGVLLNLVSHLRKEESGKRMTQIMPAQQMEMAIGFKGI